MICALQNCFQYFYVEYAFRFQLTQDIQNALPAAITVIRICDLSGQNFRTGTFFIAKLVYMAGHDHFPKVSVPIHSLAVYFVEIAPARCIEFALSRKDIILHAGNCLIIILLFHDTAVLHEFRFTISRQARICAFVFSLFLSVKSRKEQCSIVSICEE